MKSLSFRFPPRTPLCENNVRAKAKAETVETARRFTGGSEDAVLQVISLNSTSAEEFARVKFG